MDPYGLAFVSHLANYNLGQWGPICIVFTIYLALDAKDVAAGWGGRFTLSSTETLLLTFRPTVFLGAFL